MKTSINRFFNGSKSVAWLLAGSLFAFNACQSDSSNSSLSNTNTQPLPDSSAGLSANSGNTPTLLAVAPPFVGVDVPFQTFKVSNEKPQQLETETGTTIAFAPNTFVDKNGNPIKGDIEIKYREFHDAADILASGIPMQNPETGEYMETAGMFEIAGKQLSGEEIKIKDGGAVVVNMGSFNGSDVKGETPQFDFFELKRPTCGWDKKGTAKPKKNENKENRLRELDNKLGARPNKPIKAGESDAPVFELDVDYNRFPELKLFKNVVWQYAGNSPKEADAVFETNWNNIQLFRGKEEGVYDLELKSGTKTLKIAVQPALKGGDHAKAIAQFEEKMKAYENVREVQAGERDRLDRQADLVRSFQIQSFGIFNWDIWKRPEREACPSMVAFDDQALEIIKETLTYFLITESNKSVVRYSFSDLAQFSFVTGAKNKLVTVLPGNKVAAFTNFSSLDSQRARTDKTYRCPIKMKVLDKKVENMNDIAKTLAGL